MELTTRKKTYYSLSIFRLIGILSIMIGHGVWIILDKWMPFWGLTGDPREGFMVLSGLLYANKEINSTKSFYKKSLLKLFIPVLAATIFLLIGNITYMGINNNWDFISVWAGYTSSTGEKIYQFANWYFVFWTAVCYLALPALAQWNKKANQIIIWLGVILNVVIVCFIYPGLKLLFPCFVFGYFFGKKKWTQYFESKDNFKYFFNLIIWILIVAFSLGMLTLSIYSPNIFLVDLINVLANTLFGVSSFFAIVLIAQLCVKNVKKCAFLLWTDKVCYYIYIYNQCWGVGGTDVRVWSGLDMSWCIVLFIVLALSTAIIMYYLDMIIRLLVTRKIKIIENKH